MAKERKGYTYKNEKGHWYARLTFTNEQGTRRDIKRRAENEKSAKKILSRLLREIDEFGLKTLDSANMTFAELCDVFQEHYLKPAEYVGERKVAGVRSIIPALAAVKALRTHFWQPTHTKHYLFRNSYIQGNTTQDSDASWWAEKYRQRE